MSTAAPAPLYHQGTHLERVKNYLYDHARPVTLAEISQATGIASTGSIASRIRELREQRHGGFVIERRPTDVRGVFTYEMI